MEPAAAVGASVAHAQPIEDHWWADRIDHLKAGLGFIAYRAAETPLTGRAPDFRVLALGDAFDRSGESQALVLPLLTYELLSNKEFVRSAGAGVTRAAGCRVAIIAATSLSEMAFAQTLRESNAEPWDLDVEALAGRRNLAVLLESVCLARVRGGDAAYLTPIEARLARELGRRGISYQRQVFIGFYCVDFLVGGSLVVECDGAPYHDTVADHARDEALRAKGYPVIRLAGTLVHHDVSRAVDEVEAALCATTSDRARLDSRLTQAQANAVRHASGAARVSAPAGSGKTRVIEERVRALVAQGADPGRICAISFTNRAVGEMRTRLSHGSTSDVHFTTLHALAKTISEGGPHGRTRRLVQAARSSRAPTRRSVLQPILREEEVRVWRGLELWLDALTAYRQSFAVPDLGDFPERDCPTVDRFLEVHQEYDRALEEHGLTDYEGFIINAVRALARSADYRDEWAGRYDHWIVDEYQDLPAGKLGLVRLLVAPRDELFVVGDDDQIIYGFAGASPAAFTRFGELFPQAGDYVLDTNFRCDHEIVVRSSWLISRNAARIDKQVRPDKPLARSDVIQIGDPAIYEHEALKFVGVQLSQGVPAEEIALLFRLKDYATPVELQLERAGIPHVRCARASFFERRAVRAIRAWLRLTAGIASSDDVRETLKWPKRYLAADHLDQVTSQLEATHVVSVPEAKQAASQAGAGMEEGQKRDALESWCSLLERVASPLAPALALDALDLATVVGELEAESGCAPPSVTFDVFRRLAAEFDTTVDLEHWITARGSDPDFAFDSPERTAARAEPGRVLLASIHAVKGQEFRSVAVLGPPDSMPDRRATTPEQLEEERRIAYVAITRAESALLFAASSQYEKELSTSPEGLNWASYRRRTPLRL